MRRKIRKWLPHVLITLVFTGAGCWFYTNGVSFLDLMELRTIDLRFQARGELPPGPEVVLAVIDEKSIAREGRWVWPRAKIARLIDKLSAAGARVVAFDIGFLEPDDRHLAEVLSDIQQRMRATGSGGPEMLEYLERVKFESDNDRILAEAIKNSDAEVVLGYFFQMDMAEVEHVTGEEVLRHQENVRGSRLKIVRFTSEDARSVPLIEAVCPQSNIKTVSDAADYSGFFNMFPDWDGVVRRMPALLRFNDSLYAPLSLMALSAYLEAPASAIIADYGVAELEVGGYYIPTDELGLVMINYRGGARTFPHISVTDILHDEVPGDMLKDKIVFVGATATGIYDLRVTPFSSVYPGLEIHANMVDSILAGDFLYQPDWSRMFNLLAIVVSGVFLGLALPRAGAGIGALAAVLTFGGYILLCQYLFSRYGWILNIVYPLTVMAFIYVTITAYRYLAENRQKKFIKGAFSTYLAPSVVTQLIETPENLVLGGVEREITAFFSDVQGFTSISEKLTPKQLVELLNEFLTEMTDFILEMQGTVDKFEGDAIIAFFGAPNVLPDHAVRACVATVKMQKRLVEMRRKWAETGSPLLYMRVGLCTGLAVVGNMGSKNRMDYTMMGDTVNTAARLEGVNKVYGSYSMISETTFRGLDGQVATRELDAINVVGKSEPVKVYELLGFPEDIDPRMKETCDLYAEGLAAYRKRRWDAAAELFDRALSIRPEDGPSRTMKARCLAYRVDPPGENWNGSYTMTSK